MQYIRIVATLAHIDVVIWVDWTLRAKYTTKNFNGAIGNNLFTISRCDIQRNQIFTSLAFMLL